MMFLFFITSLYILFIVFSDFLDNKKKMRLRSEDIKAIADTKITAVDIWLAEILRKPGQLKDLKRWQFT